MRDFVVEETRAVRREISSECGHDPERLVAYYLERQEALRQEAPERFVDHEEQRDAGRASEAAASS